MKIRLSQKIFQPCDMTIIWSCLDWSLITFVVGNLYFLLHWFRWNTPSDMSFIFRCPTGTQLPSISATSSLIIFNSITWKGWLGRLTFGRSIFKVNLLCCFQKGFLLKVLSKHLSRAVQVLWHAWRNQVMILRERQSQKSKSKSNTLFSKDRHFRHSLFFECVLDRHE